MVDRLSPIDQRLKPPPPVRQTAKKPKDPAACASGRAIGDNGSTMLEDPAASASADSENPREAQISELATDQPISVSPLTYLPVLDRWQLASHRCLAATAGSPK